MVSIPKGRSLQGQLLRSRLKRCAYMSLAKFADGACMRSAAAFAGVCHDLALWSLPFPAGVMLITGCCVAMLAAVVSIYVRSTNNQDPCHEVVHNEASFHESASLTLAKTRAFKASLIVGKAYATPLGIRATHHTAFLQGDPPKVFIRQPSSVADASATDGPKNSHLAIRGCPFCKGAMQQGLHLISFVCLRNQ
eukprot:5449763-Amphidinium_carterae.1